MKGMNKVLLGSLVLLLDTRVTAWASNDRTPSPKPDRVAANDGPGIDKKLEVNRPLPGPTEGPSGGFVGTSGSLQNASREGTANQAVAVERSLRRLAHGLR